MKIAILARGDYSLANRRVEMLRTLGIRVFFISLNKHSNKHDDNYYIDAPGLGGLRYIFAIPSVFRLLRLLEPDLVDCHGASSYGIFSWFVKVPLVISIYGPDLYDHGLKNKVTKIIMAKILNNAALLSCSSSSLDNYLKPYVGVKNVRTAIIPYGTEKIEGQETRRKRIRDELGLNNGHYLFIHTRRFMEFWRVEKTIEAFIRLEHEGAKLAFVFPRPNEKEMMLLSKLRSKLNAHEKLRDVHFVQDLPYEEFLSYQAAADCFICIGENDLFANSLIEAMVAKNALILNKQEAYLAHLERLPVQWVQKPDDSSEIAMHMEFCLRQDPNERSYQVEAMYEYALTEFSAEAAARRLIREYEALVTQCR
jgi:glycosyltransferase involved in cell wall biosynthesis